MNRRQFIGVTAATVAGAALARAQEKTAGEQEKPAESKAPDGACGLSCAACRMHLNGKCKGCGQGMKAECPILQCARKKGLKFCAQCKGLPCPKLKESGKFGEAWLKKLGEAEVPAS